MKIPLLPSYFLQLFVRKGALDNFNPESGLSIGMFIVFFVIGLYFVMRGKDVWLVEFDTKIGKFLSRWGFLILSGLIFVFGVLEALLFCVLVLFGKLIWQMRKK